jgi:hypothetical protein
MCPSGWRVRELTCSEWGGRAKNAAVWGPNGVWDYGLIVMGGVRDREEM